ncbi:MAG: peroxide stress protein YaaA [Sphaerochaetaceae bacterium]|jgi:cytoplasmic iron level regulating protein YaaA (DUF328/UPF0246 family)
MKIIISPAKKMRTDYDFLAPRNTPVFIDRAKRLVEYLKGLSYDQLKVLLACNDEIATLNYDRYRRMDLEGPLTNPAILSYDGIQYKYMAPQVFETKYYEYIEQHLRILSGLYGILRPFDGVVPYRLEMQAKVKTDFCKNLYDYWNSGIFTELTKNDNVILNLASEEYSKIVSKFLVKDITYITCVFGEMTEGKVKEKGVYVKMARGEMVRFMAENNITDLQDVKRFDRLGFVYRDKLSDEKAWVFVRNGKEHAANPIG